MSVFNFLSLFGGLALFLFGMNYMGNSLEKLGSGKFELILEKMTNSRIKGVMLGAGVTAIIQSSSAVTVMTVGFVNSAVMSLRQGIGIIMGANIGTTITSWILSLSNIEASNLFIRLLKPSSFTPILAFIGIILYMTSRNEKKKDVGSILLGFSILIFGMDAMSSAVAPLKDVPGFTNILTMFSNPIFGVLAGAVLTAIIQSSSASVGILQALAVTGAINVKAAFPIILGQNIGTCVTAVISSVGTNKNAKRTAVIHLAFNTIGVILAMILFYGVNLVYKLPFINKIADASSIAVIHTAFNLFSTLVLFPFAGQLEKLAKLIIKDTDKKEITELVDERFLLSSSYAINKVKEQADLMGKISKDNIFISLDLLKKYSHNKDDKICENEQILDKYEDELETYLVKISSMNLSVEDSIKLSKLNRSISNFERIGDYSINILKIKRRMNHSDIHFTPEAEHDIEIITGAVREIMEKALAAFTKDNINIAAEIEPLEQVINNLKEQLRARHFKRLQKQECTIENGIIFFDLINCFERIADHCANLAVCIIELSNRSYHTHTYLNETRNHNRGFMEMFEDYLNKYKI